MKYPHKQNIARTTAKTANLRTVPRVIIFMANVLLHPDLEAAGSYFWLDTALLSRKGAFGQGYRMMKGFMVVDFEF